MKIEKAWLEQKYLAEGLSEASIGKLVNRDGATIHYWLKKYGIPTRPKGGPGNHVSLTLAALEFLEGNLLGDGGVYAWSHSSACYMHGSAQLGFLENYIAPNLLRFGIQQSGTIGSKDSVYTGKLVYLYRSKAYRELLNLQERWYRPTNIPGRRFEKHVPDDLVLTPVVLREWFIGDGCIKQNRHRTSLSSLTFSTNSFAVSEVELLCEKLSSLNLRAKLTLVKNHGKQQPIISFTDVGTIKSFFDIIGPCPDKAKPYYGYKWPDTERLVNHNPIKLTDEDIQVIRASSRPVRELAQEYGVHRATIYKIKKGTVRRAS